MLDSLILVWICIFLFFVFIRIQRPKNFPPGPRPLPIFGNLFQLDIVNPLKDLDKLIEMSTKTVLTKQGMGSTKPLKVSCGIILADYGPSWKEHRRFALMTLRNFGLGKQSMEKRILGEIEHIVAHLEKSGGSYINPKTLFHDAASNIIYLVLFGIRYNYEDQTLKALVRCFTEITKLANGPWGTIYDTLPLVRALPLPFKKAIVNSEKLKKMAADMINKHKMQRVSGEPRDLVDCYLDQLGLEVDDQVCFDEEQLVGMVIDLHGAGTDTTSNTLLTAFLYLMTHPDIQEKCQQEIDEVLKGKAQASFEDRHNMPYTQAVIHESQRIADTVPLSVFHCTTRDTQLMGYSIPKGTLIIPNLSSILSEEGQWKFPHEFNPANFLNEQGQFEKPEAFLPFSAGPRMCLGEGLARMELFLILVTLLRRFQFVWPEDAGEPDFTPVYGITVTPKPYRMGVRLRHGEI
ncbi:cytochrome P450 2C15-like [Electrophorus electricus]|uniref:cytochrome P450 2C15-like n=1 Tax=Electrophorus electricus TaxID=8005 RepID=UPI0015D0A3CF|nr:cytochrome P450 2C15-like [Electrophorus electricus]